MGFFFPGTVPEVSDFFIVITQIRRIKKYRMNNPRAALRGTATVKSRSQSPGTRSIEATQSARYCIFVSPFVSENEADEFFIGLRFGQEADNDHSQH